MRYHAHQIGLLRRYRIGLILFCVIASASAAVAQETETTDVIKVSTNLVVFDVQVFDKKTKTVLTDLAAADFEILDRGNKQTVTYFSHDELPLSIMLLLDVSVAGKLALLIDHLRLRYAVGFRPTEGGDENKFRPVEIKIASPQTRPGKTIVLTKRGYYFRRRSDNR